MKVSYSLATSQTSKQMSGTKYKLTECVNQESANLELSIMSFPRISVSGGLILILYSASITHLFNKSLYGEFLSSGAMMKSSSTLLNSFTSASSMLNVLSHSGVVLGALNDTYVISILIGVGFDVMTRILQLIWWVDITRVSFYQLSLQDKNIDESKICHTVGFLAVSTLIYIYHMIIHLRALWLNSSLQTLTKVLTGALNNLRGIPGDNYHDHIFAYTDLGGHLLPLTLSGLLLKRRNELWAAFRALVFLIISSYVALSRIPFNKFDLNPIIGEGKGGSLTCGCSACVLRTKRKGEDSSFTFNSKDGVCQLWLHSFEDLSTLLCSSIGNKCR